MTGLFRGVGRSIAVGIAFVSVVALTACTTGPAVTAAPFEQVDGPLPAGSVEQLDAVLAEAVGLSGASAAIAGVWAPWAGEWTSAIGTDGTDAADVTTSTTFRIGTQSETFACAVLLSLVDEGKVALSDHIDDHVDRLPGLDGITYGDLCQHTSGLGDYYSSLASTLVDNPTRVWPRGEIIASGMATTRTGVPGESYAASRTDAVLLSFALEELTGTSYAQLLDEHVIDPLGLSHTSLPSNASGGAELGGWVAPRSAGAPVCDAMRDMSSLSSTSGGAAAGMVSSLDDMHRWSQALATGSLLGDETSAQQWKGAIARGADAASWHKRALGADVFGPLRGSIGDVPGTLSASFTEPETGLTVVVAINNSTAGAAFAQNLAFALASIAARALPVAGGQPPLIALPWSLDQAVDALRAKAVCAPPAE